MAPEKCDHCEFTGTESELRKHMFFKALTHDVDHDRSALREQLRKNTEEGTWPSLNDGPRPG